MSNFLRIFPARYFESAKEDSPVLSVGAAIAVGNNNQVVAGVSGKRIRVMGWVAQSITGAGQHKFINGSGGAAFTDDHYSPLDTTGTKFDMPITPSGYFETTAGTGLYVNVGTNNLRLTLFYIVYTP